MGIFDIHKNVTADDFRNEPFVLYEIVPEEIHRTDLTRIKQLMLVMKEAGYEAKNKLVATSFSGYDYDPREAYLIPDIRHYVAAITETHPEIFYFLSVEMHTIDIFLFCLFDVSKSINTGAGQNQVSVKPDIKLLRKIDDAVLSYGNSVHDDCIILPSGLFGLPKQNYDEPASEQALLDELAPAFWNQLQTLPLTTVSRSNLKEFVAKNKKLIQISIDRGYTLLMDVSVTPTGVFNMFIGYGYGDDIGYACKKCQTTNFLIYKPSISILGVQAIWLPSLSFYHQRQIELGGPDFVMCAPVPIDPSKDKWICPQCGEIHSFRYSGNKLYFY